MENYRSRFLKKYLSCIQMLL